MSSRSISMIILVFVVLILLFGSIFTVREGESALTLRLGKLTKDSAGQVNVYGPGLHAKLPFIVHARNFDVRLQTLNVDSSRILTEEQKYVLVDYYAKWRISNLPLYYRRTGGFPMRAELLLKQKINDALRAAIGNRTIKEVISGQRLDIMSLLKDKANESAKPLGITVTDVRIQAIDLPKEVRESVYQRMRSEREQVATKHRAQGRAKAEAIRANADASVTIRVAKAKTKGQQTRSLGDAQAAKIYNEAYNKDAQFYAFYRSLEAYRQVFKNKGTVMVLKPTSQFFKYFNEGSHRVASGH